LEALSKWVSENLLLRAGFLFYPRAQFYILSFADLTFFIVTFKEVDFFLVGAGFSFAANKKEN